MKTSVRTALGISLIWIILALVIYLVGFSKEFFALGILFNLFCLLAAIAAGLFLTKKENNYAEGLFLDDFKTALQGGIIYAIVISGFIYMYHEYIDPSIKDALVENRIAALHEAYPNEAAYQVLRESDPKWKDMDFNDFIENQEDQTRGIISSFSVFVFHLMGLFIFSMFFAFFATIIMRKVILRQ